MSVRNLSVATARSVVLEATLPAGMTVVSRQATARGHVRLHNGTVRWELDDLAPGAGRRLSMTVAFGKNTSGRLLHHATAVATNAPLVRDAAPILVQARRVRRPRVTG